ncbi:MAG: hypothetical protein LBT83_09565 [Tannerella sp.]|nr:hypothetical protein [Tannerella sp.]
MLRRVGMDAFSQHSCRHCAKSIGCVDDCGLDPQSPIQLTDLGIGDCVVPTNDGWGWSGNVGVSGKDRRSSYE